MPLKPRDQWVPNPKLQAARERVYGRKSRTPFANAVKRRCEERLGGYCGVDHRKIRRWEEGACAPDPNHQEVICDLFDVPWEEREELGFGVPASHDPSGNGHALEVDTATAVSAEPALDEPASTPGTGIILVNGQHAVCDERVGTAGLAGNGRPQQEGSAAKRRDFMRLVKVFACTPVPLDALERFAAYCERPRAIDEALVRDVERLTGSVGAAYDTTAPRRLLVPTRLLLKRTTRLLAGSMHPVQRLRLLCCASEAALVVGYLRFSLGERIDARAYFLLTEDLAVEASDGVVQARALGALSTLHSTTYQGGITAKALQLAEQANAILPQHAPVGVSAWLAIREAVERAASRDADGYGRLTEQAEIAQSHRQDELGMFNWWNEGFLNGHNGTCLWLLNQPAAAEPVLLDGLKHSSVARPRARIASDLAGVYAAQDAPEAACSMGMEAIGCVLEVRYVLGLQRLLVVREGFPDDWADFSFVQEFDEALRAAVRRIGG